MGGNSSFSGQHCLQIRELAFIFNPFMCVHVNFAIAISFDLFDVK